MSPQPPALEDRLILALDLPSVDDARRMIDAVDGTVRFYKIGLQLQYAGGLGLAEELARSGRKVFLDSKFLDIPEQVRGGVASVARMGVTFLTVHANRQMFAAAAAGRGDAPLRLLFVTVLTSLDAGDLAEAGFSGSVADLVLLRARQAVAAGADGIVASPEEAAAVRALAGDRLTIVTPGIRPAGTSLDDQKRIATPAAAIRAGADHLVVGRPITRAADPAGAARAVLDEIAAAL